MTTTLTRQDTTGKAEIRAVSETVRSQLTAGVADDHVLHQLGVEARSGGDATYAARYRLLLDWRPPHVGAEIAVQQLDLSLRRPHGSACPEEEARPLLQRAVAVLAERATRHDLAVVGVAEQETTLPKCVLFVLHRLT